MTEELNLPFAVNPAQATESPPDTLSPFDSPSPEGKSRKNLPEQHKEGLVLGTHQKKTTANYTFSTSITGSRMDCPSDDRLIGGDKVVEETESVAAKKRRASEMGLSMSEAATRAGQVPTSPSKLKFSKEVLQEARDIAQPVVTNNPNAKGILLVGSHQYTHESIAFIDFWSEEENIQKKRLRSLDGIEQGAKEIEKSACQCGLAVVRVENPSKELFLALITVLKEMKYPESYKYFFFYTTGHGANRVFFTRDGSISYQDVYDMCQGLLSQRYLFFDCCRSSRLDPLSTYPNGDRIVPPIPEFSVEPGNRIIYATVSGRKAWGKKETGVSFMTEKIVKLLKEKGKSMDYVIRQLQKEIAKVINPETREPQQVLNVDGTSEDINLWDEQKEDMKPTIQVESPATEDGALIGLDGTFPPSVTSSDFHKRQSCHFEALTDGDGWKQLEETSKQESLTTVTAELRIPVDVHIEDGKARFRLVSELQGGLRLESEPLSAEVPEMAKPVINSTTSVIHFKVGRSPTATVSWKVETPLSVPFQRFQVSIYRANDEDTTIASKEVDLSATRTEFQETFTLPSLKGHKDGDKYTLKVTAVRIDDWEVNGDHVPLRVDKGFAAFASWAVSNGVVLSTEEFQFNQSVIPTHSPFVVVPPTLATRFYNTLLTPVRSEMAIYWEYDDNVQTMYCAYYSTSKLTSSQQIRNFDWRTCVRQKNEALDNEIATLPIDGNPCGLGLLSMSMFTLYTCLAGTISGDVDLEFLLYLFEDKAQIESVKPLQQVPVVFDASLCANTSILLEKPNTVLAALSTSDQLAFSNITSYVEQVYYNVNTLNLNVSANKIPEGSRTVIQGKDGETPVCFASVNYNAVVITFTVYIKYTWTVVGGVVWALLVVLVLLPLLVYICCAAYKNRERFRCRQTGSAHKGNNYQQLAQRDV